MIRYCLKKWDKNRKRLEKAIWKDGIINDCEYEYLVKLVVDYILNDEKTEKKVCYKIYFIAGLFLF